MEITEVNAVAEGANYDLYLETTLIINDMTIGDNTLIYKEHGWTGCRYTIRPTVKGLADLYYNIRNDPDFGSTARGVNYTDRALKLYRTWYESGYIFDRFDGHYGTCVKTRPFPEIAKYKGQGDPLPPNPDYIIEYSPWLTSWDFDSTPYYVDSPTANWYNYSNVPFGQANYKSIARCARFVTVSRHVMPENEEWHDITTWTFNLTMRKWFDVASWNFNVSTMQWNDISTWSFTILTKTWHNIATCIFNLTVMAWHNIATWTFNVITKTWNNIAEWSFQIWTRTWNNIAQWTWNLVTLTIRTWHDIAEWSFNLVTHGWHTISYWTITFTTEIQKKLPFIILIGGIFTVLMTIFIFYKR